MSKRQKFVLLAVALAFAVSALPTLSFPQTVAAGFGLCAAAAGAAIWTLGTRRASFLILPALLTLGFSLIYPLLLPSPLLTGLFLSSFITLFYLSLLTSNVFKISLEREEPIPLFRAAQTVSFLLILLTAFLLLVSIYKFNLVLPLQLFLAGLVVLVLAFAVFGALSLAALTTFAFLQVALALSFFPTTAMMRALFLTTALYSGFGILQHYFRGGLTRRIVIEYLATVFLVLVVLLFGGKAAGGKW